MEKAGNLIEKGYEPNDDVRARTRQIDLVTVMGPTGVGKDTIMRKSGLHVVKGRTSRDPRQFEQDNLIKTYTFIDDEAGREKATDDLERGNFVQALIHPTTGELYGSHIDDFPEHGLALFDVIPQQYLAFLATNPFNSVRGAYVVAPTYKIWQTRLHQAAHFSGREHIDRMREARKSLYIALSMEDGDALHFIVNDDAEQAAEKLRAFAEKEIEHDPESLDQKYARVSGVGMLHGISGVNFEEAASGSDRPPAGPQPVE